MASPDTALFPAGKAPAVSDLAGGMTNEIFEATEWFIRMLGAWSFFTVHRQPAAPTSPSDWDIWLNPATLSGGSLTQPNARIYDPNSSAFEDITKERFAQAVVALGGGVFSAKMPLKIENGEIRLDTTGASDGAALVFDASANGGNGAAVWTSTSGSVTLI